MFVYVRMCISLRWNQPGLRLGEGLARCCAYGHGQRDETQQRLLERWPLPSLLNCLLVVPDVLLAMMKREGAGKKKDQCVEFCKQAKQRKEETKEEERGKKKKKKGN